MSRQLTTFGAILCLVAIVSFAAWPFWQWLWLKEATAETQRRVQDLVAAHPELKPALNIALMDKVLTPEEADEILKGGGGPAAATP